MNYQKGAVHQKTVETRRGEIRVIEGKMVVWHFSDLRLVVECEY